MQAYVYDKVMYMKSIMNKVPEEDIPFIRRGRPQRGQLHRVLDIILHPESPTKLL